MSGPNINPELTDAARRGAAGAQTSFDDFTPSEQQRIIDHLEYNDSERLVEALTAYARTLTRNDLDAILIE